MTIEEFAELYVDFIEPALKIGAFLVLVIVVMHFLNLIKNRGGHGWISQSYKALWKWLVVVLAWSYRSSQRLLGWLWLYVCALATAVMDVFKSKN